MKIAVGPNSGTPDISFFIQSSCNCLPVCHPINMFRFVFLCALCVNDFNAGRWPAGFCQVPTPISIRGLDPREHAVRRIGQQINIAVGAGAHIANAAEIALDQSFLLDDLLAVQFQPGQQLELQ